jgi:nicotinamidase-related amidase
MSVSESSSSTSAPAETTVGVSPSQRPLGDFSEEWVLKRARQQSADGRAQMEIEPGRTALLVVDMIDEFVRPNWSPYWVPDATRQVPTIRQVVDAFHAADLPVIYLAYEVGVQGRNFPITETLVPIGEDVANYASSILQEVAIFGDLAPQERDLVVLKHCYSGFHGTELDLVLRSLDISTLVISGTMTNYCCGATAREAFWHGYKVVFGSDINSTDDPQLHDAELQTLRRGFARIMNSDEILDALAR